MQSELHAGGVRVPGCTEHALIGGEAYYHVAFDVSWSRVSMPPRVSNQMYEQLCKLCMRIQHHTLELS